MWQPLGRHIRLESVNTARHRVNVKFDKLLQWSPCGSNLGSHNLQLMLTFETIKIILYLIYFVTTEGLNTFGAISRHFTSLLATLFLEDFLRAIFTNSSSNQTDERRIRRNYKWTHCSQNKTNTNSQWGPRSSLEVTMVSPFHPFFFFFKLAEIR